MSKDEKSPVIVWFRKELRLADHKALATAIKSGAPVLPLYIHDVETKGAVVPGGAARWWLHESLKALNASLEELGGGLILRKGRTRDVLADILGETNARAIHATQSYEPFGTRSEADVDELCSENDVAFHLHPGRLLFAPGDIATKEGNTYRVFTPFWKSCLAQPAPPAGRRKRSTSRR
jgi:deoxyribodipyrimidine photo-lyase